MDTVCYSSTMSSVVLMYRDTLQECITSDITSLSWEHSQSSASYFVMYK
jgi:hypothetical protein